MTDDIFSDKLLVNLRILSKIPKNGRICRSSDGLVALEGAGTLVPLRRFLTNDSRRQTVVELDRIIRECVTKHKGILQAVPDPDSRRELLRVLQGELDSAIKGVENLKTTYQDDQNVVSHLDIFLLKMGALSREMTLHIGDAPHIGNAVGDAPPAGDEPGPSEAGGLPQA